MTASGERAALNFLAFTAKTTRAEAISLLRERFDALGWDEPDREARRTLIGACGLSPLALIVAPEAPLGEAAAARLEAVVVRRVVGEPLSRILGKREFWGLPLAISPDVLDPRPDTETIVDAAVALMRERRRETLRLLDLGVGSGALLAALLSEFGNARGVGVDLSAAAARTARANLAALGFDKRAEIRVGRWADGLSGPFDLIVANPPYIASADLATLPPEVRDFDPLLALDGGADGLDAYRAIVPAAAALLAPGGLLLVEVGAGQAADVLALVGQAPYASAGVRRDLAGIERVVVAGARLQSEAGGGGAGRERIDAVS